MDFLKHCRTFWNQLRFRSWQLVVTPRHRIKAVYESRNVTTGKYSLRLAQQINTAILKKGTEIQTVQFSWCWPDSPLTLPSHHCQKDSLRDQPHQPFQIWLNILQIRLYSLSNVPRNDVFSGRSRTRKVNQDRANDARKQYNDGH
jgi:hypothetical protein